MGRQKDVDEDPAVVGGGSRGALALEGDHPRSPLVADPEIACGAASSEAAPGFEGQVVLEV